MVDQPEQTGDEPEGDVKGSASDSDAVNNALRTERDRTRSAQKARNELTKERDQLAADLKKYETELQKLNERAETAERTLEEEQLQRLRYEVAVEKGLVGKRAGLANRLQGTTKKELLADADNFLELVPDRPQTSFDGGQLGGSANGENDMDSLIRGQLAARRGG